jgi:hypothetical protein
MLLRKDAKITPEEFVVEEDLHCGERKRLIDKEVNEDNKTICTLNLPDPPKEPATPPGKSIRHGPLTSDPSPPIAEDEDAPLATTVNQAELMQWHCRLGHLLFQKLKQLVLNGKIPKKLSKLQPSKCAGCLFGPMTKLPWRSKESASSQKVVLATKPGETVSVDQMESTKVGFFPPALTRKRTDTAPFLWTTTPNCVLCISNLTTLPQ